jgi:tetratricopeptide (TPR) repeat protein
MTKYLVALVLLLTFTGSISAQNKTKIDSLYSLTRSATEEKKIELAQQIAKEYLATDFHKSLLILQIAKAKAEKGQLWDDLADVCYNLSNAYFINSNYDSAMYYAKQTMSGSIRNHYSAGFGKGCLNIGAINLARSRFENALVNFQAAERIFTSLNSKNELINVYNNMGVLYSQMHNGQMALFYYNKAVKLLESKKEIIKAGVLYSNMGGVCENVIKDYDKALYYNHKALVIFSENNSKTYKSATLNNIGKVLTYLGNYDEAEEYLNRALEIKSDIGDEKGMLYVLHDLGVLCKKRNRLQPAIQYLESSNKIAKGYQLRLEISENLQELSSVYALMGKYQAAYQYQNEYLNLKDSLYNENIHKQISELNQIFESEQKEHQIKSLKEEAKFSEKIRQDQLYLILVLIGAIVLLAIIGRQMIISSRKKKMIYRQKEELHLLNIQFQENENRRLESEKTFLNEKIESEQKIRALEQQQMQSQIDLKNRELASITVSNLQHTEFMENLLSKLGKAAEHKSEAAIIVQECIGKINGALNNTNDWNNFKIHFDNIHPHFFVNLIATHPTLTQYEIKLSAYLLLNLSSKEIATLLNISPDAVNKSRYRLRKKMKLDSQIDLYTHLSHFLEAEPKV